jgi:hypothetical protein
MSSHALMLYFRASQASSPAGLHSSANSKLPNTSIALQLERMVGCGEVSVKALLVGYDSVQRMGTMII